MPRPERTINFGQLLDVGYGDQWAVVPRSLTEGYLYDAAKRRAEITDQAERLHRANIETLLQVRRWNFLGSDEEPLPLPREIEDPKELSRVVHDVPMEIIGFIAIVMNGTAPEKAKALLEGTTEEAKKVVEATAATAETVADFS